MTPMSEHQTDADRCTRQLHDGSISYAKSTLASVQMVPIRDFAERVPRGGPFRESNERNKIEDVLVRSGSVGYHATKDAPRRPCMPRPQQRHGTRRTNRGPQGRSDAAARTRTGPEGARRRPRASPRPQRGEGTGGELGRSQTAKGKATWTLSRPSGFFAVRGFGTVPGGAAQASQPHGSTRPRQSQADQGAGAPETAAPLFDGRARAIPGPQDAHQGGRRNRGPTPPKCHAIPTRGGERARPAGAPAPRAGSRAQPRRYPRRGLVRGPFCLQYGPTPVHHRWCAYRRRSVSLSISAAAGVGTRGAAGH